MNIFELKPHPYSKIFPDMTGTEFSELTASVKKLGRLRYPVIVYEEMILDGRHRIKACRIAKVEPKFIEFKGSDREALDLVWDMNAPRRHLNSSQRAFCFAEYCKFLDTGIHKGGPGTTLDEAAAKASVGKSTMQRAKIAAKDGTEEQKESIRQGKSTVKQVASAIRAKPANGQIDVDASGIPIPKAAKEFWDRRLEATALAVRIRYARKGIKDLNPDDAMWSEVNLNGVISDLSSALNRMKSSIPAYVCPYCKGMGKVAVEICDVCKGRGVISKYMWDVAIPEEMKNGSGS